MSTKKKVNSAKGKRYTQAEKENIIAFVNEVNSKKGRGGQSSASKKFKISPLTISSWIRSGVGIDDDSFSSEGPAISGRIGRKLEKLKLLHSQIARAEKELTKMKAQFNKLKGSL